MPKKILCLAIAALACMPALRVAAAAPDDRAVAQQVPRAAQPDAAATPGDERRLPGQHQLCHVVVPSSCRTSRRNLDGAWARPRRQAGHRAAGSVALMSPVDRRGFLAGAGAVHDGVNQDCQRVKAKVLLWSLWSEVTAATVAM